MGQKDKENPSLYSETQLFDLDVFGSQYYTGGMIFRMMFSLFRNNESNDTETASKDCDNVLMFSFEGIMKLMTLKHPVKTVITYQSSVF